MQANIHRRLFGLLRRKLPSHLRTVEDFYYLSFSVSAIFCLILLAALLSYTGQNLQAWTCGICAILLSIFLALWRHGVHRKWVQFGYQSTLMGAIIYNAYYTGGITSPVMVWMGSVQILPLFTLSRRWSYAWLSTSFFAVLIIYWAQLKGWIPSLHSETTAELTLSAIMIGLLCVTQIVLVTTYDSANAQTLRFIQRSNQTLRSLTKELHQANIHKDQFLATVSHEMRTPLNAIIGYLGLLQTTENLPTQAVSYTQHASNSAAHLLTVINDLLDYSQIQHGKLVLTPQTIQLHQVITQTHQTLAPQAASQALDYPLQIAPSVPQWVNTDPHRLAQILLNIIGNALKFTQQGSVTTQVQYTPHQEPNQHAGTLIIQVLDSGIGISQEAQQKIFDPFVQLGSQNILHSDNALRGNGLGLSITQSLIKNMGGQIHVKSQPGQGSTFTIKLPLQTSKAPQALPEKQPIISSQNDIQLLLVDDHVINRLVASATIKRALPNAHIDEASNGTEAIEKMMANHYDIVLMDLSMPDYSGIEVVRKIRLEAPASMRNAIVIALTANVSEQAIQECKEVGIHTVLTKPFDREILIRTLLEQTPPSGPSIPRQS